MDHNDKDRIEESPSADAERIQSYIRAGALDNGVLINAIEMAQEAAIRFPVALTGAA
jgi:hypothetical protein